MKSSSFPLSQKYIDFINTVDGVDADFLEGTTASGKTTVGAGVKFMRMVSRSKKKSHIIAAKTTGIAEKNIIQQDNGILDIHPTASYYGNGDKDNKLPHIKFEDKIIYVLGYDNKDKWTLVLGSQFGCVFIDEINTANIEFVREVSTRNDYLMATLNPDDPSLPVYKEFINRARPYKKYAADVPREIMAELSEEPVPTWRYWFFTFRDNLSLSEEDIQKKIMSAPAGTKLYKNKILGLRGKATGLVFPNFGQRNIIKEQWLKEQLTVRNLVFDKFTSGLDTSYSRKTPDTVAMTFSGITTCGKLVMMEEKVMNNAERGVPFAPSDIAGKYVEFLDYCCRKWDCVCRNTFVDSADQATITELIKYKRKNGVVYIFNSSYKIPIIDRINMQNGWIQTGEYLVLEHCTEHIHEMNVYSWDEDKDIPEDGNDHTINSGQYGWAPYMGRVGQNRK